MESFRLVDAAATEALARALAPAIDVGTVLLLEGELGAGKTTFTRALVASLGGDPLLVHSPTFSLVHQYEAQMPIFHLDCYRLSDPDEWFSLGVEDQLDQAVACIEWPSKVAEVLPDHVDAWQFDFAHDGEGGRLVTVQPSSRGESAWSDIAARWRQELS
jgi:tRNA threonylcarbamoyl adenosine modification protein YjeE